MTFFGPSCTFFRWMRALPVRLMCGGAGTDIMSRGNFEEVLKGTATKENCARENTVASKYHFLSYKSKREPGNNVKWEGAFFYDFYISFPFLRLCWWLLRSLLRWKSASLNEFTCVFSNLDLIFYIYALRNLRLPFLTILPWYECWKVALRTYCKVYITLTKCAWKMCRAYSRQI